MTGTLARHECPRLPPQIFIDDGRQLVERGPVAVAPGDQELSDTRSPWAAHVGPMIAQPCLLRLLRGRDKQRFKNADSGGETWRKEFGSNCGEQNCAVQHV